jgi:hypothetical protein
VLSQSTSNVVVPFISSTCPRQEQSFARCYTLANEGCSTDRIVTGFILGIGRIVDGDIPGATINVYKSTGCLNGAPGTGTEVLLASLSFVLQTAFQFSTVAVPLNTGGAVIGVNEALLIELVVPAVFGYDPGANSAGQSAPSFIKAVACGIPNYVTLQSVGFGQVHWVLGLLTAPLPTSPPTPRPTAEPTVSFRPTPSPTPRPTPSPTPHPTTPDPCDAECDGTLDSTPMALTKLGQCIEACVPDDEVESKEKFGWECGTCP